MMRCLKKKKNVKSFVESWEMFKNETALYAENENFDAEDDTQCRAYVLNKEIYFHKNIFESCHSRLNDTKSTIQFYISRKNVQRS